MIRRDFVRNTFGFVLGLFGFSAFSKVEATEKVIKNYNCGCFCPDCGGGMLNIAGYKYYLLMEMPWTPSSSNSLSAEYVKIYRSFYSVNAHCPEEAAEIVFNKFKIPPSRLFAPCSFVDVEYEREWTWDRKSWLFKYCDRDTYFVTNELQNSEREDIRFMGIYEKGW